MTTITLADGSVIDAETGAVVSDNAVDDPGDGFIEVPTHFDTQREMTVVRRTLNDLPEPPERMNAIALIAMYHLYGLSDSEISIATRVPMQQVQAIQERDAFGDMVQAVSKSIVQADADDVRQLLSKASKSAAQRVIGHLNSRDSNVSMAAAKDVLDRSGHRPADVIEHRHRVEGGLTIEYVEKRKGADDIPMIDVTPTEDE